MLCMAMRTFLCSFIFVGQVTAFFSYAQADVVAGKYELQQGSKIAFTVQNFLVTTVEGQFKVFSGNLDLLSDWKTSAVKIEIETGSIDTDNKERDTHLKTVDFFDVAKFPKIVFVAKKIEGDEKIFTVSGDLTIKDHTQNVDLKFENPKGFGSDLENIAVVGKTTINRKDFGITHGKTIANDVGLVLTANFKKIPAPPADKPAK